MRISSLARIRINNRVVRASRISGLKRFQGGSYRVRSGKAQVLHACFLFFWFLANLLLRAVRHYYWDLNSAYRRGCYSEGIPRWKNRAKAGMTSWDKTRSHRRCNMISPSPFLKSNTETPIHTDRRQKESPSVRSTESPPHHANELTPFGLGPVIPIPVPNFLCKPKHSLRSNLLSVIRFA